MTTRPGYVWDTAASEWVEIGQAAVVSPFKYQTSQPSSPATGDIWIDSDDEVPSVDSTLYYRWTKTMSGGETSLSGTDNNSLALKYTPGYESVFINGVLQVRGQDYVATTGTTVTGLIALTANDVVMVESIIAYSVGDTYTQTQMTSLLGGKSDVSTTGMVLLNTTTVSASSGVQINNLFSSTYDQYFMIFTGTCTSNSAAVGARLSVGGTPNTSTVYFFGETYITHAAGPTRYYQGSANTTYFGNMGDIAGSIYTYINNPFLAVPSNGSVNYTYWGTVANVISSGGWSHNNSVSYDGLYLYPSAGTITGTFKFYGIKK
jgi:hypothetical protein